MTISFINQENEEITKIDWRIDSYKFKENLWQPNSHFCFAVKTKLINLFLFL